MTLRKYVGFLYPVSEIRYSKSSQRTQSQLTPPFLLIKSRFFGFFV